MSNMSYCRFQNTATDLRDCLYALRDMEPEQIAEILAKKSDKPVGRDEAIALRSLFKLCSDFVEEYSSTEFQPRRRP